MHSHDRTLLAKLGFADPDRKESRHDLAVQYLTTEPVVDKMVKWLYSVSPTERRFKRDGVFYTRSEWSEADRENVTWSIETPISKGEGQYRTTIGYMDLAFDAGVAYQHCDDWEIAWWRVIVEVKITPTTIGDILRQVALYKSYEELLVEGEEHTPVYNRTRVKWVVAVAYPISVADKEMLQNEDVSVWGLGDGFKSFVSSQSSKKETAVLDTF